MAAGRDLAIVAFRGTDTTGRIGKGHSSEVFADLIIDLKIGLTDWGGGEDGSTGAFQEALEEVWPQLSRTP